MLADPRIEIYDCGRGDIRAGRIDRRVLATMLFLAASGLKPTISSLECGHARSPRPATSPSTHGHGDGHLGDQRHPDRPATQGPGSITEQTIRRLLTLQGAMTPHQIISLMRSTADNTFAMGDHADHIHVGWQPETADGRAQTFRRRSSRANGPS